MTTYHHRFEGHAPLIRWSLYDNDQQAVIARGSAVTKESAWRKSTDAVPMLRSHEERFAQYLALFCKDDA